MIYIVIALVNLCFLFWNVLNETVVLDFFNTKEIRNIKLWHLYDAILRCILIPIIILYPLGINWSSIKLLLCIGIFYHFGFNILLNFWRKRKEWKIYSNKERIDILLYLSEGSIIDSKIIKFSNWIEEKLSKIRKKRIKVNYRKINISIILLEILIIIFIWL